MTNNPTTQRDTYMGAKAALVDSYNKQNVVIVQGFCLVAGHIYSWLGPANYMAYSFSIEVIDQLEDMGLLKHKVKQYAKHLTEAYANYKRIALGKAEKGDPVVNGKKKRDTEDKVADGDVSMLWDNLCERVYRKIEKDIVTLYWTVNSYLKKTKVKGDIDLYSKIFVAHMLYDLSLQRFEAFFKALGDKFAQGYDYSDRFPEFKLEPLHSWWIKIEDAIVPADIVPEFVKDENCHKAYDVIAMKLNNIELLNSASTEALSYDPVFAEKSKKIVENWQAGQKQIINDMQV